MGGFLHQARNFFLILARTLIEPSGLCVHVEKKDKSEFLQLFF